MPYWTEKTLLKWGERIFFMVVILIIMFPLAMFIDLSIIYVVLIKIIFIAFLLLIYRLYNKKILNIYSITKEFYSNYDTFKLFEKVSELSKIPYNKKKSTIPHIDPEDKRYNIKNPTIEVFFEDAAGESVLSAWPGKKYITEGYFVFPKNDHSSELIYKDLVASNYVTTKQFLQKTI
jgi:hypothetical protein